MAIFNKKENKEEQKPEVVEKEAPVVLAEAPKSLVAKVILIQPRLSEKATSLASQHKYVFKVALKANKLEVKKAVERAYGVKVAFVNMLKTEGKKRRYGAASGKMSDFKKAVVTLTKDSKGIDIVEAP